MAVAHIAVYFRARNESRDGVNYYYVKRTRTRQCLNYLECLLAVVGLRYQKGINIYAEIFCIYRVKSMLRINKRSLAAELLRLCHNVQRKCGFTR